MMSPEKFVQAFKKHKEKKLVKFAKVVNVTGKLPTLLFDGESKPTVKGYPHLDSYVPTADERVMVIHGVIVGKIINGK